MKTDSYSLTGDSHEVCQDASLSGSCGNISYAIITDGCSESYNVCKEVDLGARLLAYSARDTIMHFYRNLDKIDVDDSDRERFGKLVRLIGERAHITTRLIGKQLFLHDLFADATLLIAISDGITTNVFMYGDGCCYVKNENGEEILYSVEFTSGAPYYLSYLSDPFRSGGYVDKFGDNSVLFKTRSITRPEEDTNVVEVNEFNHDLYTACSFSLKNAKTIAIMSDGVGSFVKTGDTQDVVPEEEMVSKIINIKNMKGVFVERHLNFISKKIWKKENISHFDDLSVAVIACE